MEWSLPRGRVRRSSRWLRGGRLVLHPVAVMLTLEDLAHLEETLAVLGDPQALADIREADAAYAADVVRGVAALRALRS